MPITFTTVGTADKLTVSAKPGDGVPMVMSGYQNVDVVGRANRQSITRWSGMDPVTVQIPVLLDEYLTGGDVEDDIDRLERMAGRFKNTALPGRELKVLCPGKLVPHADEYTWLITDLSWGDAISNAAGYRLRQQVTVTITQYVAPATETALGVKHQGTHARFYVVKKGDTLRGISRKVFGTPNRWDDIRKLNKIPDPRTVGKVGTKPGHVGQRLKMPQ